MHCCLTAGYESRYVSRGCSLEKLSNIQCLAEGSKTASLLQMPVMLFSPNISNRFPIDSSRFLFERQVRVEMILEMDLRVYCLTVREAFKRKALLHWTGLLPIRKIMESRVRDRKKG